MKYHRHTDIFALSNADLKDPSVHNSQSQDDLQR